MERNKKAVAVRLRLRCVVKILAIGVFYLTTQRAIVLAYLNESSSHLHEFLFNSSDPRIRTDSAIVIKNGRIIFEAYRDPQVKIHKIWSISKSLTNALIGIAIKNNKLKLSDSVCNYFSNIPEEKCAIKIRHLLEWSSGIDWIEDYSENPETSSVLQMFYGDGIKDMVQFALQQPVKYRANTHWNYSSADPTILMGILKNIYGSSFLNFPKNYLFDPLGMKDTTWEMDASGTFLASSHAFSTPRDLAKFGQWMMRNGRLFVGNDKKKWQKKLLPAYWRQYSTTVSSAYKSAHDLIPGHWGTTTPAGAGWWPNKGVPNQKKLAPWPAATSDAFAALGFKGQYLFVMPSQNLVIVRLGYDATNSAFDANEMISLVGGLELTTEGSGELL